MGVYGNGNDKKKKSSGKSASSPDWRNTVFVTVNLDKEDRLRLEALLESGELGFECIPELVADGYRFSVAPDNANERFVAALTDKGGSSPFNGYCLSGSGATPNDAIHSLLYKHFVKLNEDWTNVKANDGDRWG